MTINLPDDLESSVRAELRRGRHASEDALVAEIVRAYFDHKRQAPQNVAVPSTQPAASTERKPLWERAAELRKSIPEEEWAKLPADGAEQLDHYLHGSPKRPTS